MIMIGIDWIVIFSLLGTLLVLVLRPKMLRYGLDNDSRKHLRLKPEKRYRGSSKSSNTMVQRLLGIIERLVEARLKRYWTQSDVADQAKISLTAYKDTEGGKRVPRLSTIRNICRAFNLSAEDLG